MIATIWVCLGMLCVPMYIDVHGAAECLQAVEAETKLRQAGGMWVQRWRCPPPIPKEKPRR